MTSCAAYDRTKVGFWDQKVAFTAWGVNFGSEFGLINVGYIQWNRNITPLTPTSPTEIVTPAIVKPQP